MKVTEVLENPELKALSTQGSHGQVETGMGKGGLFCLKHGGCGTVRICPKLCFKSMDSAGVQPQGSLF